MIDASNVSMGVEMMGASKHLVGSKDKSVDVVCGTKNKQTQIR